ncbi:MAG: hypothetical protein FWH37_10150, partial [Candidatus Bathyarchaeota archaeon]|nr:hypothetical protein [Candidatus Termiticorpusculum sp.]
VVFLLQGLRVCRIICGLGMNSSILNRYSKLGHYPIFIVNVTISTSFIVNSPLAQTIKPTIPKSTIKIVKQPYDVTPITTTNPYTSKITNIQ